MMKTSAIAHALAWIVLMAFGAAFAVAYLRVNRLSEKWGVDGPSSNAGWMLLVAITAISVAAVDMILWVRSLPKRGSGFPIETDIRQ